MVGFDKQRPLDDVKTRILALERIFLKRRCVNVRELMEALEREYGLFVCVQTLRDDVAALSNFLPIQAKGWAKTFRYELGAMTNADRIRAMSDEELAEFLDTCEARGYQDSSIARDSSGHCIAMLEWLQQPAEEVDHEQVPETGEQVC